MYINFHNYINYKRCYLGCAEGEHQVSYRNCYLGHPQRPIFKHKYEYWITIRDKVTLILNFRVQAYRYLITVHTSFYVFEF